jgi:hypothetical protein
MAKNNTIRNNVFISSGDARLTFPRSSNYTFEKNIIQAKGKIIFEGSDAITALQSNVLFNEAGKVECRKLERYSQAGSYPLEPQDGNLLADPLLVEFAKGRVRVGAESPVRKLGIMPIDVSGAGPRHRTGG